MEYDTERDGAWRRLSEPARREIVLPGEQAMSVGNTTLEPWLVESDLALRALLEAEARLEMETWLALHTPVIVSLPALGLLLVARDRLAGKTAPAAREATDALEWHIARLQGLLWAQRGA